MNNCENCYHFHMCDLQYRLEEHQDCEHYKDKSLIIELPCKSGDTVYSFCEMLGTILEYKVVRIELTAIATFYEAYAYTKEEDVLIDTLDFEIDDIGETVFLSREEAEKKLKECENENNV